MATVGKIFEAQVLLEGVPRVFKDSLFCGVCAGLMIDGLTVCGGSHNVLLLFILEF
jgi:hypothetical protein